MQPRDHPRAVLHLVHSLVRGGTEGQCASIAMGCAARGHTHHRVAVMVREGDHLEPVEDVCEPVAELGTGRMVSGHTWRRVHRIRRQLSEYAVGLVHAWDAESVIFGSWAARAEGIPLITSQRDLGQIYAPWKWRCMLRAHRRAAAVVVNAACIRDRLVEQGIPAGRIHVLPNAVDMSAFVSTPAPDGCRVIMVSRLDPEKDVGCAIRAARQLQATRPHLEWLIVGDGPERAPLQRQAAGANVRFLGRRPDIPALLESAAIGVLTPAANEGLSNALIEYGAAARPIVATDCGGNAELVQDGVNGYLVPAGDAEALADRIGSLADSPQTRRIFGAAGRSRMENRHALPVVIDRFERLYEACLHEGLSRCRPSRSSPRARP